MQSENPYTCINRTPGLDDFLFFRELVGWDAIDPDTAAKSLENTLFSTCVYAGERLIGFGRIVGDGAMYYYIQDVIVLEEYRGKGVGWLIMKTLLEYIEKHAANNAFIALMAAWGAYGFYEKLGFSKRDTEAPGMYKKVVRRS